METIWFCLVALMITVYVVLDGFDLGAGIVHLFVARTDAERRLVLRSIGPVWDGNEVWLLAAGGTLYFAFPELYASSFSGFYLPLMIVLWLLILRGISIEFRSHLESPVWAPFWDVVFAFSSLLLAVFYGAALGNVVRGVPLDEKGYFFEALWTDLSIRGETGILDWYTILVGVTALCALTLHGSLWVALKTEGDLNRRARQLAAWMWWAVVTFTIMTTAVTFHVQPHVTGNLGDRPWGFAFAALAVVGLIGVHGYLNRNELRAFLSSCAYLVGMLTSVAFGLYPLILPASTNPAYSLTVFNARSSDYALRVGLVWWTLGMVLVTGYFVYTYRNFAGKVRLEEEGY